MKWTYNHCTDVVQRNTVGRFPAAEAFALTLKQKHGCDCDDVTGICSSDPGVKASLASVMWDSLKQSFGLKGSTFNERKKNCFGRICEKPSVCTVCVSNSNLRKAELMNSECVDTLVTDKGNYAVLTGLLQPGSLCEVCVWGGSRQAEQQWQYAVVCIGLRKHRSRFTEIFSHHCSHVPMFAPDTPENCVCNMWYWPIRAASSVRKLAHTLLLCTFLLHCCVCIVLSLFWFLAHFM